jgi:hypothetical protein
LLCPSHFHLIILNFGEECKSWNYEACHYAVLSGLMLVSFSFKYSTQHSVLKHPMSGYCKDHLITHLQRINDTWWVCIVITWSVCRVCAWCVSPAHVYDEGYNLI